MDDIFQVSTNEEHNLYSISLPTNQSTIFDNFLKSCRDSFNVKFIPLPDYINLKEQILKEYGARHVVGALLFDKQDEMIRFLLTYG